MPRKKAVKDENVNVSNEVTNEVSAQEKTMQNEIEPEDVRFHENVADENLLADEPSAEETSAETSLSEDLLADNLLEGSSSEETSVTDNPSAENPTTDADGKPVFITVRDANCIFSTIIDKSECLFEMSSGRCGCLFENMIKKHTNKDECPFLQFAKYHTQNTDKT